MPHADPEPSHGLSALSQIHTSRLANGVNTAGTTYLFSSFFYFLYFLLAHCPWGRESFETFFSSNVHSWSCSSPLAFETRSHEAQASPQFHRLLRFLPCAQVASTLLLPFLASVKLIFASELTLNIKSCFICGLKKSKQKNNVVIKPTTENIA